VVDTIVYVSVYVEMPSPGAGLLRYARLKAGLSQSELAKDRAAVSAALRARKRTKVPG
jgi:hypothetical protein